MVRLPRLWISGLFSCWLLAAASHAFDETADPWIRGVYTGNSPRARACDEAEAWQQAIDLVSRTPDAFILVGTGRSMQPLYPAGTLLVLRTCDYRELQRGQTVVYRSEQKRAVGHVLIAKARDGWRVQGLNNRMHDMEPVVAENLIGVVVAAFQPQRSAEPRIASARRPSGRAVFLSDDER